MKVQVKSLSTLTFAFVLSSCASGYKPDKIVVTERDEDTFRLHYIGNTRTSAERALDYSTLRASQLCLERGLGYIDIENSSVAERNVEFPQIDPSEADVYVDRSFDVQYNKLYGPKAAVIDRSHHPSYFDQEELPAYTSYLTVNCLGELAENSLDARQLNRKLMDKYGI